MNIALLRAIQDRIRENPPQFEMMQWFSYSNVTETPVANWGTACCIAGWAVALHYGVTPETARKRADLFPKEAVRILDLTYDQGRELFYTNNWPTEFQLRYKDLCNRAINSAEGPYDIQKQYAQLGVEVIDDFIARHTPKVAVPAETTT